MKNLKALLSSDLSIFVLLSVSVLLYVVSSLFATTDAVKLVIDILAITLGFAGSLGFFLNQESSEASNNDGVMHV